MSSARYWARRAALSALAGSGLTAAGLGGPLSGGALAADTPTTAGSETSTPTTTEAAPETPQTTTSTANETPPATSTATSTETTPTPPVSQPSTPTTTAAPAPTTTTPASTGTAATPPPVHKVKGPHVLVQHDQEATEGESTQAPAAGTPAAPSTSTPQSSEAIAPAPQLAAGEPGTLAALLAGSAASDKALAFYRIPLFLLPIYQAAAVQYGVPWEVLAAINEVETDFGNDQNVSSAGAVGWMQFMPETWLQYGVDAVNAGYADPYNPVDAIFAAARYLHAAGASKNLHDAILAYNHSEAYVESVLLRARLFASYPASVIGTLTGLTEGSLPFSGANVSPHSPLPQETAPSPLNASSATASAGAVQSQGSTKGDGSQAKHTTPGSTPAPSPAASAAGASGVLDAAAPPSQLSELLGSKGAPVLAVEDGRIVGLGRSHKLGKYLVLRDTYGDLFTYAGLGSIVPEYRLPKPAQLNVSEGTLQSGESESEPTPTQPASEGRQPLTLHVAQKQSAQADTARRIQRAEEATEADQAPTGKVRVFAHPGNPDAIAAERNAARLARERSNKPGWHRLTRGSVVTQGTVLGHLSSGGQGSHAKLRFAIRPAGSEGAIDPRPIFENWKQLAAALHPQGAKTGPVLAGATASDAFLLSKEELQRAVLSDPGIQLAACDRAQVVAGKVGRRALALLVFLSRSGLKPTVANLRCASSAGGASISTRHTGDVLDITAVNGVKVSGHQGAGSVTDIAIRTLLSIQHRYAPRRIVSLMKYPQKPTTIAAADHADYIEIDLAAAPAKQSKRATTAASHGRAGASTSAPASTSLLLNTREWHTLIGTIGNLQTPKIARKPSSAAVHKQPASGGGHGLGQGSQP